MSEHFGVPVQAGSDLAEREVSGRFASGDVRECVENLALLCGAEYRTTGNGGYLISSGRSAKRLVSFPSYGLRGNEAGLLGTEMQGGVVGDRLVVMADESRRMQVEEVMRAMGERRAMILEVVVLDLQTNAVDRVNAWLDSFKLAAGTYANTFVPSAAVAGLGRREGLLGMADITAVWTLLDLGGTSRIESREQLQVMSGSTSSVEMGTVVADVTYQAVAPAGASQASQQLVSTIQRRVVGLTLEVTAAHFGEGRWWMKYRLEDSSLTGQAERRNSMTGERLLAESDSWILIASLTRRASTMAAQGVPGFSAIPVVGKAFTKKQTQKEDRQLLVMCRPLLATSGLVTKGPFTK